MKAGAMKAGAMKAKTGRTLGSESGWSFTRGARQSRLARAGNADVEGSQIVELAVTLPLMMVMLVGIMGFGQAFNLKHKLDTSVREGARFASSQPGADLTNPVPGSVNAVRDVIHNYLQSEQINDCGLAAAAPVQAGLAWTYTANAGCPANLTLVVDRGFVYATAGGTPLTVEATRVTISYPFQWRFNRVIRLVAPGANYAGISQLTAEGFMQNLD